MPFEPQLLLFYMSTAENVICRDWDDLENYCEVMGFLQLLIMAASNEPPSVWRSRFTGFYTGASKVHTVWRPCAAICNMAYMAGLKDPQTNEDLLMQKLITLQRRPSVVLEAVSRCDRDLLISPDHSSSHRARLAVPQGTQQGRRAPHGLGVVEDVGRAIRRKQGYVFESPYDLLPPLAYTPGRSAKDSAAFERTVSLLPAIRQGIRRWGKAAIWASYVSTHMTHLLEAILEGDAQRPTWIQLHDQKQEVRVKAIAKWANSAEDEVIKAAKLFGSSAHGLGGTSRTQHCKGLTRGTLSETLSRECYVKGKCGAAVRTEGHALHSAQYERRLSEIWAEHQYLLRDEDHSCKDCGNKLTFISLTDHSRQKCKAEGRLGQANLPFNWSLSRIDLDLEHSRQLDPVLQDVRSPQTAGRQRSNAHHD